VDAVEARRARSGRRHRGGVERTGRGDAPRNAAVSNAVGGVDGAAPTRAACAARAAAWLLLASQRRTCPSGTRAFAAPWRVGGWIARASWSRVRETGPGTTSRGSPHWGSGHPRHGRVVAVGQSRCGAAPAQRGSGHPARRGRTWPSGPGRRWRRRSTARGARRHCGGDAFIVRDWRQGWERLERHVREGLGTRRGTAGAGTVRIWVACSRGTRVSRAARGARSAGTPVSAAKGMRASGAARHWRWRPEG
jgi:hypothetical protein